MMDVVKYFQQNSNPSDEFLLELLNHAEYDEVLRSYADTLRKRIYGKDVYLRGLIEISSYCRRNCRYCGLRCENTFAERYRVSKQEILSCCQEGYALGFRTFVLQGGEDAYFTDDRMCDIISEIRKKYPDCAITLSLGEKSAESYRAYYEAGANRYLLRHETADNTHYACLHPENMSCENRKNCLFQLKEIGYQVGAGFMVGSPAQEPAHILADLRFLQQLQPDMIGIGPFIPAAHTPFAAYLQGSLSLTLKLISILRIMFPYALIPATTALGTIHPKGRELGLQAGANVVMPNLTPQSYRKKYAIYDNKICTGEESAQCKTCLEARVSAAGYQIVTDIGNAKKAQ